MEGIGTWWGKVGYARVHVHAEPTDTEVSISISLDDHHWNDQLRDGSFADWEDAAMSGVGYGLQIAEKSDGCFLITRIVGLMVDTVPQFVAYAAAVAVWEATE